MGVLDRPHVWRVRCFHPLCTTSGQPIQSVCFKGVDFTHVSHNPVTGTVMSVSR